MLLQTDLMILECGKQRNGFKVNCKSEWDYGITKQKSDVLLNSQNN